MSTNKVWETKSYKVEWLESPIPSSQRKLLMTANKKLKEIKKAKFLLRTSKDVFATKDIQYQDKKLSMDCMSLKQTIVGLQETRKAVYILHKKTGLSQVFDGISLKEALDEMRASVRALRRDSVCGHCDTQYVHDILHRRKKSNHPLSNGQQAQDKLPLVKMGGVHTTEGTYKSLCDIINLQKPKEPTTTENHVGVEIEFASFLKKKDLVNLLIESKLDKNCQLHHEFIQGRHGEENEYEISLTATENEFPKELELLCNVLNDQADANVTFGCGLHVHIDCRNRDEKKVYNNLFHSQPLLYSMVNQSRKRNRFANRTDKKYWYPISPDYICEKCDKRGDGCICSSREHILKANQNRYVGVNTWSFLKHKTIEVRMHSGTSNYKKILNWVKLLILISDADKFKGDIKDVVELNKLVAVDSELMSYVNSRVKTFNKEEE